MLYNRLITAVATLSSLSVAAPISNPTATGEGVKSASQLYTARDFEGIYSIRLLRVKDKAKHGAGPNEEAVKPATHLYSPTPLEGAYPPRTFDAEDKAKREATAAEEAHEPSAQLYPVRTLRDMYPIRTLIVKNRAESETEPDASPEGE